MTNPLFDTCDTNCILDPFAEADEDTGETKQSQNYIHIRIQRKLCLSFGDSSAIFPKIVLLNTIPVYNRTEWS